MHFHMGTGESGIFKVVDDGLRLCRAGDWKRGLPALAAAVENRGPGDRTPGLVYSFLGYGTARYQNRGRDGLKLCEHAIKVQYYEADNHWNLARVQLLLGERRQAVATIARGLKLDPDHKELLEMSREIGNRRRPVLGFLDRDNPVNILLGRLRQSLQNGG